MQARDHALSKGDRQLLVASLVDRMRLGTQDDLLGALAGAGCRVTQATVSRDLRELGIQKVLDPLGRQRYVLPGSAPRPDPRGALEALLSQYGRSAIAAGNLVVVHCRIGSAPAIARGVDQLAHPLVLGTLAGDDTFLVIAADPAGADVLAAELTGALDGRRSKA